MTPEPSSRRIDSIDLLRGLVIVLMGLDHVRDFFSPFPFQPEDLEQTSAALFFTRWVTHFCAPVFVFLAGTGAWLWQARGRSRRETARFLITRGLWLILLEVTVINFSWLLPVYVGIVAVQVIWVIGASMIFLAGVLWLPRWVVASVSIGMIVAHNLLDGIQAAQLGAWGLPWGLLHQQVYQRLGDGFGLYVVYPLIPWLGVLALGYVFGPIFRREPVARRRLLLAIGLAMTAAFIALRASNLYGDPGPWSPQERGPLFSLLSFLNTNKYPPSLLFLLMTLGPAITLLPLIERARGTLSTVFVTFGRVPLFFYLIHVPVIHAIAALYSWATLGTAGWWFDSPQGWPAGYEPNLIVTWAAWISVTVALYPVCAWFAGVKRRRRSAWLSYL